MPKKLKKSNEDKAAESNFTVDEKDVKYATEKEVKDSVDTLKKITEKPVKEKKQVEKIESKGKKKSRKKKKKTAKKTTVKYTVPKVSLKASGYELVITEKPQAALKIANALGKAVQKNLNKVPYYEVDRNGKKLMVACAVGLFIYIKTK